MRLDCHSRRSSRSPPASTLERIETVGLFYLNAALADSTTSRGVNDLGRIWLVRRIFAVDAIRLACGGLRCADSTTRRGVNSRNSARLRGDSTSDSTISRGAFAIRPLRGGYSPIRPFAGGYRAQLQREGVDCAAFQPASGGVARLSDHLAGGYVTPNLRPLLVRERMRLPTRAIY